MVRAIVAQSDMTCTFGFEEIYPHDKGAAPKSLGVARSYSVHATRYPVPDEWVAVSTQNGMTVRPSLFWLAEILRATPVSPAPAVLATV